MKIKKIIENDPKNAHYYSSTVSFNSLIMQFLCKYLHSNEIKDEHLQNFLIFLEMYDLPPFIGGCTLKEFLQLIITNNLGQISFTRSATMSPPLNIDLRQHLKQRKVIESQKSLSERITSYRKAINQNFSRFQF